MVATADISARVRWSSRLRLLFDTFLRDLFSFWLDCVLHFAPSFFWFYIWASSLIGVNAMDFHSSKQLEIAMRSMLPCFEGRESEENWKQRERSIRELGQIAQSNAPKAHPAQFASGIKLLLDGIVKTIESLRTTLQRDGCNFVKELAKFFGSSIDPMVLDILVPVLITLCGSTKVLAKQNGDETVTAILTHVTVNPRIVGYINGASKDKNAGPRLYAAGWLQVIMKRNGHHCEHGGGLEKIEDCIRLGLSDRDLNTKTRMRDTYWMFARIWPGRAESIMSGLDARIQKTLEDHPNNPTKVSSHSSTVANKPNTASKSAAREHIAAMKAAAKANREKSATAQTQSLSRPTSSLASHDPEPIEDSATSKSTMSAPARPAAYDLIPQKRAIKVTAKPHHHNQQEIPRPTSSLSSSSKTHHREQSEDLPFSRSTTSVSTRLPAKDDTSSKRAQRAAIPDVSTSTRQETSRSHKVVTSDATTSSKQDTSRPNSSHESSTGLLSSAPVRRPRGIPPTIKARAERTAPPAEPENELIISAPLNASASDSPQHVARIERHPRSRRLPESVATPLHKPLPEPAPEKKLQIAKTTPTLEPDLDFTAAETSLPPAPHTSEPPAYTNPTASLVPDSHIPFLPIYDISVDPSMRDPLERNEDEDAITHKHTWRNKETAERRRSISPNSRDPEQAREYIIKGTQNIKSGKCDDFGYRKLQGLIEFHDKLAFKDEPIYDELLLALVSALEAPNNEKRRPLGRKYDSKFQILVTIRLMFVHNRKYFAAYYPRVMSALLIARRNFEARHHIVSGLEETAQDIVGACQPPDVIEAVLDVLETEERDEAGSRTLAMGLHILSGLSARMRALKKSLDSQQESRMAKFGLKCLREPNSIVRRAVIEYCLELRRIIKPEQRFFRLVTGDIEDLKNLITYYVANRNQ